ncbi:MAG: V-type ATP synthase subunit D [Oscillospiraceae bacterium]|jgi:V/A-type H+-transporting ATPase subunit D
MAEAAPTKGNLMAAKRSRQLAESGYMLMDKKRNILVRELMALIDQAADIQSRIDSTFEEAYNSLKYANISLGNIEHIAESIPVDESVNLRYRSIMGVEIPTVVSDDTRLDSLPYGLANTSSALDEAYIKFATAKRLIRDLAQTENAIYRLAYSVRKTQKRASALKNIVIPTLDATISRISDALEEKEREEFIRLKVIKAQKGRQQD